MEYIAQDIQDYIAQHTTNPPEFLNDLERETWLTVIMPRMLSGKVQGQFLKMMSQIKQPNYVLEVGTFTGYASHFLVEGLQPKGEFHAVEINEELERIIQKYWTLNPKHNQMHLHIGNAQEVLETLHRPWDLVFLDADKVNLSLYYNQLIPHLPSGGIMLIDNILWSGKVVEPLSDKDKDTKAILEVNQLVAEDPRVEQTILSIRDGIMMLRKL